MGKERLPWWRWALEFALGGIRSGFGLFRRNGKVESGLQANSEAEFAEPAIERVTQRAEGNAGLDITEIEPDSEEPAGVGEGAEPEDAKSEAGITAEISAEAASSPEQDNNECEVELRDAPGDESAGRESIVEDSAPVEVAPVEIVLIEAEPPETVPMEPETAEQATTGPVLTEQGAGLDGFGGAEADEEEVGKEETTEEEIELTHTSPKFDESEDRPAVKEPPAATPAPPAEDPQEPAPPAKEPPEPEPNPPAKVFPAAGRARETGPGLSFDPPMAPEPPSLDPPTPEPTTAEKVAAALKARGVDAEQSPFSVIVNQVYDGPLDLLLDLIRKQDIDIYDIPIAQITAQFLAYVDRLRASDMDVAGDFFYTAALLIHIKSKMLLPRAPVGPEESTEDPRRELVDRLLEHERFKNAAQMLHDKQMLEANTWTNPGVREFREDASAEPEIAADTTDLVRIFRDILERARNRPILNVEEDSVTVGQMIQFLARRLTMEDKPVALRRLLSHTHTERALIAMFLGLLELVRLQAILLRQDRQFSEIFVKKNTGFDAVVNEGLTSAHDDWR